MLIENVYIWWYFHQPDVHTPIHILPNHDDGQHLLSECPCHPQLNQDGNIVHASFDGREAFELGFRKPS